MNRTLPWLSLCAALIAGNVFAQVSPKYRDWGNGAIRYLMMKHEKTDWAALRTDADAKAFIDLFWARRDPTPDTPVNELRQEFEARTAEADKRFKFGGTPGSLTDRGIVYVLLGEPSEIVTHVIPPRPIPLFGSVVSIQSFQRPTNTQSWIYRNDAARRVLGTKSFDIAFDFHDEKTAADFELDDPSQVVFESTALAVAKSVLKQPFLTESRLVPFRLIVVSDSKLAYDILRRAQEGEDFSDLARAYSSHPSADHGGYVGRVPFADLTDDFKVAFAGKAPGASILIARNPQFAIVRLLTEEEAAAAEGAVAVGK